MLRLPQKGASMANEKLTHIGPLPTVSRTHELQQRGLEALRAALPSDHFIIRDERIEDYRVDCSLEAKIVPPQGSQVTSPIAEEKGPKITAWATKADASFLDLLLNTMAMHTGRIDHDEYLRREEDLISGGHPLLRAQHRLRVLRVSVLREQEVGVRSQMLDEVRGIVHEIESSQASRHFKAEAQLLLLELEGHENIRRFQDFAIKLSTRDTSGRQMPSSEIEWSIEQSQQTEQRWRNMAETILVSALKDLHPLVLADALALRSELNAAALANQYLLGQMEQFEFRPEPSAFHGPMRDAARAMALYRSLGALERELRATMTLCDPFALQGQSEAARKMARTVAQKGRGHAVCGNLGPRHAAYRRPLGGPRMRPAVYGVS
jgi:hypothetical protein